MAIRLRKPVPMQACSVLDTGNLRAEVYPPMPFPVLPPLSFWSPDEIGAKNLVVGCPFLHLIPFKLSSQAQARRSQGGVVPRNTVSP
jgi:hypothetical protein